MMWEVDWFNRMRMYESVRGPSSNLESFDKASVYSAEEGKNSIFVFNRIALKIKCERSY